MSAVSMVLYQIVLIIWPWNKFRGYNVGRTDGTLLNCCHHLAME